MRLITLAFTLLLTATHAHADALYVTDRQSAELYASPRDGAAVQSRVASGVTLEVLERRGAYVRIKTEEGQEGWMREELLTHEPPAHARLQLLARSQSDLEEEMTRLRDSVGRLQDAQARLLDENRQLVEQLREPPTPAPVEPSRHPSWVSVALLPLVGIAAFAAGAFWQARRRRRAPAYQ